MVKKTKKKKLGEYEKLYEKLTGQVYQSKAEKAKIKRLQDICIVLRIAPASEISKMFADKPELPMGDGKDLVILCNYSGRRTKGDNRKFYCDRKATCEKWWLDQGRDFCKEHGRMVK